MSARGPLFLVLAALLACKSDPQAEAKSRQDVERVTQKLAKVAAAVPDPSSLDEAKRCNDAEIKANYKAKEQKRWLTGVDYEFLKRATGSAPEPDQDPWKFLNSPGIDEHLVKGKTAKGTALGNAAYALRNVESQRYVVVFRATEREMPKDDKKAFDGGVYAGQLVVMDLETATPVCHAPLEIESSDEVEYEKRGLMGKSAQRALEDDFREQFEKTATKALRSISAEICVGLSGISLDD